jgi:hypothetical protein
MENEPQNLRIGALIRVAHSLGSSVEIKLARRKGTKPFKAPFVPPIEFLRVCADWRMVDILDRADG